MLSRFAIALFVSATLLFAGQPMVARMTVLPIAVDESLVQSLTARSRSLGPPQRGVADAIELVIAPAAGVEVVRLLGGEAMCSGRDGLTIPLPDMVHGTRRLVVAELRLKAPGHQRLLLELGQLRLSSRRPGSAEVATSTEQVSVEIAAREPDVVVDAIRRVMLVRADRGREAARALADRGQFGGAAALLRGLLAEIAQIPSFVVAEDSPLGEAHALLLDEAMAMDRNPDEGA